MASHERDRRIRRLIARGLPPGEVARVLGVKRRAISDALCRRRASWDITPELGSEIRRMRSEGMTLRAIAAAVAIPFQTVHDFLKRGQSGLGRRRLTPEIGAEIRRMRSEGMTLRAIGAAVAIPNQTVHDFLKRERSRRPRALTGRAAGMVRRLAELGHGPGRIAELLGVDEGQVAELLSRVGPDGRVRRHPMRRPWGPARGLEYRDDRAPTAAIAAAEVAELPRVEVAAPAPLAEDWGPPVGGLLGARSNHAALSDADADRVRELRARGVPRKDVAAMLGISVATVTRITRGETYRPVATEPDQVVAAPPPAIAAAEGPPAAVWDEPRRPGRRPPPDHRDD